jgi:hypothetical protein
MPTKPNSKFTKPQEDDVPEVYTAEDEPAATADLSDINFDDRQYEEDYQKINPPAGDWIKEDRWVYKETSNPEDSLPGDKKPTGRLFFTASGKPESRQVHGVDHQPVIFLRVSPDKRYKVDDPQKFDLSYRLFLRLQEAYLAIHSEKLRSVDQVRYFLEEDQYVLRTMNGDSGPLVVDIKAKPMKRNR